MRKDEFIKELKQIKKDVSFYEEEDLYYYIKKLIQLLIKWVEVEP